MGRPLAIDLYAGLGGWSDGLLAEGYDVVGFDIERHRYPARDLSASNGTKVRQGGVDFNNPNIGSSANRSFNYANECAVRDAPLTGGWMEYPAQLVIQDVLTLHGSQFRKAALIVASPPCQEFSYMAMPWSLAKAKAAAIRADQTGVALADLTALFDACFRIQREASEAAGHHIPLVVENVRGAIPWVGRSRWNFGSFHLWGDVPALMPPMSVRKNNGGSWFAIGGPGQKVVRQNPDGRNIDAVPITDGRKVGKDWFGGYGGGFGWDCSPMRRNNSRSPARKAASAMIAKIPEPLARHIAATFRP